MLEIVYMRTETTEAGLRMDISYNQSPRDETRLSTLLIINTNTPNHIAHDTGNITESKSISRRRYQTGQEVNLGVHRPAHALVALVAAPEVSLDLTLHET